MTNKFERYFFGPLVVLASLVLGELGVRYFNFPLFLGVPYALLSLTTFYWSGLRSALFSALLIALYPPLFHFEEFGAFGCAVTVAGAFMIAAPSGVLKRAIREKILEGEANRRKAELVDSLNGNVKKMLEALEILDKLRTGWRDYSDPKRFELVEQARGTLTSLITLISSWREIAKTKETAYDYLNEMGGYPYRVDDAIRNIQQLQQETLKEIGRLSKDMQAMKDEDESK